jgi:D,D-heptose 1,7-bisphosphate phosphatase
VNVKAAIVAGGKGTRMSEINSEVPKPMIKICGKPILEYQIDCLKSQGITDITLIVAHLGRAVKDYFGDGGRFGSRIGYITEGKPLGTAGAIYLLKDLFTDDFLFINGDLLFDIDIKRFMDFHKSAGRIATLLTHPNNHPIDSAIVVTDGSGAVTGILNKEDKRGWCKNRVNAGLHILSPKIFEFFEEPKYMDFDRDVLPKLILLGEVGAYDSPEYIKDVGTPERYRQAADDVKNGIVRAKSLLNRQPALFLDRDGTINRYAGFLTDIDDFELNGGIASIIKEANLSGKIVIVVTNQPAIARGDLTWEQLGEIHNKMETLLGEQGAYVDDIFVCPHHPDKGFENERAEYKIDCGCRKPKPGLILQAAEKHNIDLSRSLLIGDSEADMEAAKSAGCEGRLIEDFLHL